MLLSHMCWQKQVYIGKNKVSDPVYFAVHSGFYSCPYSLVINYSGLWQILLVSLSDTYLIKIICHLRIIIVHLLYGAT